MSEPIDVVIAWVDGSDPEWLAERRKYDPATPLPDSGEHRYRDWGLLKYLFRGLDCFMPWVRTVHFVTWGHIPDWLDTSCPRLHIVRHGDYIPSDYLPTFSANPIEMNFHRISGIAEEFIYFNDDMFVVRPLSERDFFWNGLPCDTAALNAHCYSLSRPVDLIQIRDVGVINEHFSFRKSIGRNWTKWLRPQNGSALLRTLPLLGCPRFPGFFQTHGPQSLLKSTYEEVWEAEPDILDATCRNKFRGLLDVNQWLLREWQIASGKFHPRSKSFVKPFYFDLVDPLKCAKDISSTLGHQKHSLICINDAEMPNEELVQVQQIIRDAFETLLPEKSVFERNI